ncbi:MAG: tetratricopeptide repeat protein [Candidatus Puniceispirillales bacterium]
MTYRYLALTFAVFVFMLASPFSVNAATVTSQNDETLQQLFSNLQQADNGETANDIALKIWDRWMSTSGDTATDELMDRGVYYMQTGNLQVAEDVFSNIIEKHPEYAEAWNKRATVRFLRSNWSGSADDIAQVLAIEPNHFGALSGLAMIRLHQGEYSSALSIYERVLEIHPFSPDAITYIPKLQDMLKGTAL